MEPPLWKAVWSSLKVLKIEPPFEPAIPDLGVNPKELAKGSQRDICSPIFKAA